MIRQIGSGLLKNNAADDETRRLARNVQFITLGMIGLAACFVPIVIVQGSAARSLLAIAGAVIAFIATYALARRGSATLGSAILVGATTLAICSTLLGASPQTNTPFYLALSIGIAGATLRPASIWWALAGILAALWVALLLPPQPFLSRPLGLPTAISSTLFVVMLALLSYLGAASTTHALRRAANSEVAALAAQTELADLNRSLEQRIDERTAALEASLEKQRTQSEELRSSIETQELLNRTILDLSLPVIPVTDRILIAPLIGNIDSRRANELLSSVLSEVERRSAHALVLDVTGVSVIDTAVAQALLKLAEANRLLGSRTILVGIRPEVAQALTSLGVDFGMLASAATLQQGLSLVGVDLAGRS